MQVAQRLYGSASSPTCGTDSVTLRSAIAAAGEQVRELFGAGATPDSPRAYQSKVKNAQEAHEAIRPAGERSLRHAGRDRVSGDEFRLYELIWMRTVASQMKDAVGHTVPSGSAARPPPERTASSRRPAA